jgi:ribosome-associated toxin RatA of RatAB toxin-antitoxin module
MGDAMSTVQQAIEVSAPLHTVYEQLATFESYPQFMTGVEQVTQISDDQTHWVMDLDGQRREFDATITECSLDERVSWSTMDGPLLAETITLRPVGETRTQIVAQLEADVAFLMPSDRHGQESLNRRLKADLASFKKLIEIDATAGRQLSGTGTINNGPSGAARSATIFGGGAGTGGASSGPAGLDPASPAAVAARTARNRAAAAGDPGGAAGHAAMGGTQIGGTQIGGAGMGGQAMSADDAWGDGMINEEERGSAHDL